MSLVIAEVSLQAARTDPTQEASCQCKPENNNNNKWGKKKPKTKQKPLAIIPMLFYLSPIQNEQEKGKQDSTQ